MSDDSLRRPRATKRPVATVELDHPRALPKEASGPRYDAGPTAQEQVRELAAIANAEVRRNHRSVRHG